MQSGNGVDGAGDGPGNADLEVWEAEVPMCLTVDIKATNHWRGLKRKTMWKIFQVDTKGNLIPLYGSSFRYRKGWNVAKGRCPRRLWDFRSIGRGVFHGFRSREVALAWACRFQYEDPTGTYVIIRVKVRPRDFVAAAFGCYEVAYRKMWVPRRRKP